MSAARSAAVAGAILLLALGPACDDGDPTAASPSTTRDLAAPTTTPGTGDDNGAPTGGCPSPPAGAAPAEAPAGAATIDLQAGQAGGEPARVWVEPAGGDSAGWTLAAVVGGAELRTALPIEDRTAEPRVLGGHDIDGDGGEEVLLEVGRGAAATLVGLATLTEGCLLAIVTSAEELPAYFPVGASAGTQRGLRCEDDRLVELAGTTTDGRTYDWSATTFQLTVATLRATGTETGTFDVETDRRAVLDLGRLDCGDVDL